MVWAPDTKWANEVREECAAFPAGDHDDFSRFNYSSIVRFRQGGFVKLPSDYEEEELYPRRK